MTRTPDAQLSVNMFSETAGSTPQTCPPKAEVLTFRAVYQEHAPYVWRVLRRFGVQPSDLEDVSQEVFMVVHRKLHDFERRSSVRTWLYGIAFRCAGEHRRRVRERPAWNEPQETTVEASQPASVAGRQARELMAQILGELDDPTRAVFVLYELEELAMTEIAEIVGCPIQTAYSRLHIARRHVEAAAARLAAKETWR